MKAIRFFAISLQVVIAPSARADAERFAVIIGHNRGSGDEVPLRYAEVDALKIYRVLTELAGFRGENTTLLRGPTARHARQAVIATNDLIRHRRDKGLGSLLVVFYSGHADSEALHLGDTELALHELEQLVSGSAAGFRLLIVDACRSGALTRVKGGWPSEPFSVHLGGDFENEGLVVLTSAAEGEAAHESDELRGSFFTHYLVSGLRGAADRNRDGMVALHEAYRFAYDKALRASSRSMAGAQHATFSYRIKGRSHIVLTDTNRLRKDVARLSVPAGIGFFVFSDIEGGEVVAEIGANVNSRRLAVSPGTYFVRGRGQRFLLETTVVLGPGEDRTLDPKEMQRVSYARLVRKGHPTLPYSASVDVGYWRRSALWPGSSACHGLAAAVRIELPSFGLMPQVRFCQAALNNAIVSTTAREFSTFLEVSKSLDLRWVTLRAGAMLGSGLIRQVYETRGRAPPRNSATAVAGLGSGISRELHSGLMLHIGFETLAYAYALESSPDRSIDSVVQRCWAVSMALGWHPKP